MEKYWNTWQDMGAWLRRKTPGEAASTGVWLESVTSVVSQRRYLHAGVTLVHPQPSQEGVMVLPGLSPRTHSAWIQSSPASRSVSAVPLLTTTLLCVPRPYNYSPPWGRDPLTPWAGTLRNSLSSLPYLTPTALIHPREAFHEGLFLSNSRPPASLLRKWRGWFAVSKDLCMLPNLSSTVRLHSLGRVPVCTAGRDIPHPTFTNTMQVKKGKPAHLLLFWSIINAHLSSVSIQKHWK